MFSLETLRIKGEVRVHKKNLAYCLYTVMLFAWGLKPLYCIQERSNLSHKKQMSDPSTAAVNKSELYCDDPSVSFFLSFFFFGIPTSTLAAVFMGKVSND